MLCWLSSEIIFNCFKLKSPVNFTGLLQNILSQIIPSGYLVIKIKVKSAM